MRLYRAAASFLSLAWLPLMAAGEPKRADPNSLSPINDVASCEAWIKTRHSGDTPTVHSIGAATLCVDTNSAGLTADLAKAFASKVSAMPTGQAPRIVIRSLGGDVRYGIAMGDAIVGRRAEVFVSTFCGSSCANYIFLAAHRRYILRNGVVFFHGGVNKAAIESWTKAQSGSAPTGRHLSETRKRIEADLRAQQSLLTRAGIDPDMFEWMERINHDVALVTKKCHTKESVRVLVFSEAFLEKKGAKVSKNEGPKSQAELDRVLRPYGIADTTCFWS